MQQTCPGTPAGWQYLQYVLVTKHTNTKMDISENGGKTLCQGQIIFPFVHDKMVNDDISFKIYSSPQNKMVNEDNIS